MDGGLRGKGCWVYQPQDTPSIDDLVVYCSWMCMYVV